MTESNLLQYCRRVRSGRGGIGVASKTKYGIMRHAAFQEACLDKLQLDELFHVIVSHYPEHSSDDVHRRVTHCAQRHHHFIGFEQGPCKAVLDDLGNQQWVGLIADFEHIFLVDKSKAAVCSLETRTAKEKNNQWCAELASRYADLGP